MQDFLLDTDGDLLLDPLTGDFVIGESTDQHQYLLLLCNKGDFKESPNACIGIKGFLKDEDVKGLLAETKAQFEKDGMEVKSLSIDAAGNMKINAPYKA